MSAGPLPLAVAAERLRRRPGRPRLTQKEPSPDIQLSKPETIARLLDLEASAKYLGVSTWTVRGLVANGVIARVVIPLSDGRDLRRVLVDRQQLDELVLRWREPLR